MPSSHTDRVMLEIKPKLLATQGLTFLVISLSIARPFCFISKQKKNQHAWDHILNLRKIQEILKKLG